MFHRDRDSPSGSCSNRGRTRSLPPYSTRQDEGSKPGRAGSISLQRLLPAYSSGQAAALVRRDASATAPSLQLRQLTQRCLSEFPNCFAFQPRDLPLLHRTNSSATPFSESFRAACEHAYSRLNPVLSSSNLFSFLCHHL